MKKALSILLSFVMLLSITAGIDMTAYAEKSGDFSYELLDDGTAEITGYTGTAADLTIPSVIDGYAVTSIGSYAFEDCDSLTSVTIPSSVTSIGNWAYDGRSSLKIITVDSNNTNYSSQDGVLFNKDKTELILYPAGNTRTSYEVPNSVTSIDWSAFSQCRSLTSVIIPNSVTSIGVAAFKECSSLTSVTMPNSIISIGEDAFHYCTSLESIAVDGNNKYYSSQGSVLFNKDKTELIQYPAGNTRTSYEVPISVISIGKDAFHYCTSLTSITIPNSVTSIGNGAFEYCDGLTSVTIGESVTSIGDSAFYNCSSLTSVTIPNSVTSIGYSAFGWCDSLTGITVGSNNTNYSSQDGVLFNKDKTALIQYPIGNTQTSYIIPDSVTSIGTIAFQYCNSLTSVTIGNSVASISVWAFYYCNSLTSITIPNSVTSIGWAAFYNCSSLKDVYYSGSEAEWNNISIGDYNTCLTGATIHYNSAGASTDPTPAPTPTPVPQPATTQPAPTTQIQPATQTTTVNIEPTTTTTSRTNTKKPKSTSIKKLTKGKKQFKVTWKKVSGVSGYQVQYATDSKFKKNKKTVTVKGAKNTSKTVKNLKSKKTYYVRVRTYKTVNGKKVYSAWSKAKSVKTK